METLRLKTSMLYLPKEMQDNSEEYLEYLILNGYVEVAGIDDTNGEFLYSFTDFAKQNIPDLENDLTEEFYKIVVYLWEHGFLSMDFTDDSPLVTILPKALDEEEVNKLPKIYKSALLGIIQALRIE